MRIRLAHSPDPDDAFMFYGLTCGAVPTDPYRLEHVLADIQTLNDRARQGEYEVTAVSIYAYPGICDRYLLTSCGGSVGDNYGPVVVSRKALSVADLIGRTIAVPGLTTTAYLTLQLLLGRETFRPQVVGFDLIGQMVAEGQVDAGLLIHEGQLTYGLQGLHLVIDLGVWWHDQTGLPLPLGANAVRRDLGLDAVRQIADIIRASIRYGLDHRADAVRYALKFGRGLAPELADRFIGMYVNDYTLDYGPRGRTAIERLLTEAARAGLVPQAPRIDFV